MSKGFEARTANPCPTQIWVSPGRLSHNRWQGLQHLQPFFFFFFFHDLKTFNVRPFRGLAFSEKVYFKSQILVHEYDNTRPFLCSSIVSFWITPARSKERKYHIFKQYWYTRNVPVFTNTGMFQYLGPEVYFFQINTLSVVILWLPTFWSSKILWHPYFSFQKFMTSQVYLGPLFRRKCQPPYLILDYVMNFFMSVYLHFSRLVWTVQSRGAVCCARDLQIPKDSSKNQQNRIKNIICRGPFAAGRQWCMVCKAQMWIYVNKMFWTIFVNIQPWRDAIFFSVPLFGLRIFVLIFIFHFQIYQNLLFFQMRMWGESNPRPIIISQTTELLDQQGMSCQTSDFNPW